MGSTATISCHEARAAVDAALREAEQFGVRVGLVVVDQAGHVVASLRMDGATFLGMKWATAKAVTAAGTGTSTRDFARFIGSDPVALAAITSQPDVALLPGGVPITIGGAVAGAIGVAGAPADLEQRIAEAGIAAVHAGNANGNLHSAL